MEVSLRTFLNLYPSLPGNDRRITKLIITFNITQQCLSIKHLSDGTGYSKYLPAVTNFDRFNSAVKDLHVKVSQGLHQRDKGLHFGPGSPVAYSETLTAI